MLLPWTVGITVNEATDIGYWGVLSLFPNELPGSLVVLFGENEASSSAWKIILKERASAVLSNEIPNEAVESDANWTSWHIVITTCGALTKIWISRCPWLA